MKLRMLTLTALVGASLNATLAHAQVDTPKPFDGADFGVDLKLVTNSIAVNNWMNPVFAAGIGTLDGTGGNQAIGDVTAGYSVLLGDDGVLGFGGSYDFIKSKLLLDPNGEFLNAPHQPVQMKNHFSVYLAPGIRFGASGTTQFYVKLAYHSFKLHDQNTEVAIMDQTFNGFGYGAGIKSVIYDNWAVVVEVEQVNYTDKVDKVVNGGNTPNADVKPKTTSGLIGLQYTFDGTGLGL